jgi:hypothetical protein
MSAPFLSILTTYSPAQGMRARVQALAAYSLSLVEDAEVIVMDESGWAKPICEQYGFQRLTGMRTGKDIGLPSSALLLDDGFSKARKVVQGSVCLFITGDCVLLPGDLAGPMAKLLEHTPDFCAYGRRLDLAGYEGLIWGPLEGAYRRVVEQAGRGNRLRYGVDLYAWSNLRFQSINLIPQIVSGWYFDNWLVNDMHQQTRNMFNLAGIAEAIHPVHDSTSVRQTTTDRACTEHNYKSFSGAYPGLDIRKMETPPIVPKEWLE